MTDASDLTARLQRALGDRYRIEREIGGGGMSRLFLATEPSLGREVVVKLLPPELASEVSAARFQREIELAARFQHPNIVPVLAGGASEGLLYYVMPFVRGESLRHLLQSGQSIPIATALAIVAEVGDALSYAHGEGVVHRDIKPENILLAAGHAMVTDFGVARAVEAARSGENLTGTGIAVGSPGYMAPEQLAGEGSVDARTDQYALGTVAYELLSGSPPFVAPSLQGLVVAHLTETPRALSERRHEVPADLSAAIARALAKNPADRFPNVDAFRAALTGDGVRVATTEPRRGRRALVRALAIALPAVAVVALSLAERDRALALDENLIAVAPFTVLDPSLELWREGLVDVLSRKLDGAGSLRSVPPSIAVRRFSGRGDATSAEALGRATGAGLALIGTLYAQGADSARLEATLYDVSAGRVRSDVLFVDATSQMARLTDSIAVLLLKDLGRGVPLLSSLATRSFTALKEFLQGEQFYRRSAWDSAAAHYERAVALDSSFVLPLHRLTQVYGWRGSLTDAAVIERAEETARHARGLSRHDSLLVRAAALSSEEVGAAPTSLRVVHMDSEHLVEEAVRAYPQSLDAAMAYADEVFHFGSLLYPGSAREVRALFDRVIEIDSSFTPAYLHPILLSLALNDTAGALRYARAHLARNPSDEDADAAAAVAQVLSSPRPSESFASFLDTASHQLLRAVSQLIRSWPDANESQVLLSARYYEQLQRSNPRGEVPPTETRILMQSLAFRGHLSEAAKFVPVALREKSVLGFVGARPAALELALLGGFPASDADTLFRRIAAEPIGAWSGYIGIPYFALRRDTLSLKRLVLRIDSLRRAAPEAGQLTTVLGGGARAYLALTRGDSATALREFETMPDSLVSCGGCHVWQLTHAQLLGRAGRWRDAELILRGQPHYWASPVGVLWSLERGRVQEQLGDMAAARDNYAYVVAAWQKPDEQLKMYVDEARRALARLSSDVGRKR